MSNHIIYKTTNLFNNKIYVGQHFTSTDDGYLGSGLKIIRAIKKYGKENFIRETLEFCTSFNVDEKEFFWIDNLDTTNPEIGYNISPGGNGKGRISEESKKKMSENHADVSGKNNPNFGKKWSNEQKQKQSSKIKGRYVGVNNPNYGNGEKIKGNKNPMYGKNHTKKAIKNMILKREKVYFYEFISPLGKKYNNIYLIKEFCENFDLNYQGVYYSVKHSGIYKGWKISRQLKTLDIV